jgi:hypothetical protein
MTEDIVKALFAEDAFALHLLFQNLEGLIDIVVTDNNLHVRSPFSCRLMACRLLTAAFSALLDMADQKSSVS